MKWIDPEGAVVREPPSNWETQRVKVPGRRILLVIGLASLMCESALAAPARVRINGSAGIGYDSNVGAAQANDDKFDSAFYSASVAADYVVPVGQQVSVTLRGQLQGDAYDRFDDLSNARLLGLVRAAWKPNPGFFTPTFSGWTSIARLEYGSEIRTGSEFRGGAFVSQQLTTAISMRLEGKGFHRKADGRVFDMSGQSLATSLNWSMAPAVSTLLAFEYQTGDAFSMSSENPRIAAIADAIEPDDAFDDRVAYRLDARTRIVTAGANWRFAPDWALDAQLQSISVDGDGGNQYDRLIAVVGLLARF
ncbi:hypothetical protein DFR24_0519 [Panacagrimonas perspica]|uniref:Beta-barrel porin 2 n=1 Tax=Panacagrimonas perspica TaxID=381431 RepID=A0A4S3K1B2_9GAMM|nr:hypothetical protein DFR24_0519 [Panacagrimonas perspica]THD01713.1 hypothetical protein B1810_16970 [Panacagrimonas perspica]